MKSAPPPAGTDRVFSSLSNKFIIGDKERVFELTKTVFGDSLRIKPVIDVIRA